MSSRRRRTSAGSLAGWLFADLALVLAFVFLDSTTSGAALGPSDKSEQTSTTTTVPSKSGLAEGNSGARPEPIEVDVSARQTSDAQTLIRELEGKVRRSDSQYKDSETYLVVIVHGGSKGVSRQKGAKLAQTVAGKLESSWNRVIAGTTFFDTGDNSGLPYGTVHLKLFPVSKASSPGS